MRETEVIMGIYATDLRELIIRPTLVALNEWSQTAEDLLMGTAAQESQLGFRMHADDDSGIGLYRISTQTHTQVWDNYLITDPELASRLRGLASQQQFLKSPHNELIINLSYATGVAWMIYKRHNPAFSDNPNVHELATYWLHYYCTRDDQPAQLMHSDDAKAERFIQSYHKLVLRENKNLAA
jgi:hypothetical protein